MTILETLAVHPRRGVGLRMAALAAALVVLPVVMALALSLIPDPCTIIAFAVCIPLAVVWWAALARVCQR